MNNKKVKKVIATLLCCTSMFSAKNRENQANAMETFPKPSPEMVVAAGIGLMIIGFGSTFIQPFIKGWQNKQLENLKYKRRMAAQRAYDEEQKKIVEGSSVSYDRDWATVSSQIDKITEDLIGNHDALQKIKRIIGGNYLGVQNGEKKCTVINLYGSPGSGKSHLVDQISSALGVKKPLTISLADIDKERKDVTLQQQVRGSWTIGEGEKSYIAYGKLVAAFKFNDHLFLRIDEADKLPLEFFFFLWDVIDTQRITINGKDIDCSGTVIMLTSNNPLFTKKKIEADTTQTLGSLASRITEVEFKAPTKENFVQLLTPVLQKNKDFARNVYSVNLSYGSNILDLLAERCLKANKGLRALNDCSGDIKYAIASKIEELKKLQEKNSSETPLKNADLNQTAKNLPKKLINLELKYDKANDNIFCDLLDH